jgi:hypothetical protein
MIPVCDWSGLWVAAAGEGIDAQFGRGVTCSAISARTSRRMISGWLVGPKAWNRAQRISHANSAGRDSLATRNQAVIRSASAVGISHLGLAALGAERQKELDPSGSGAAYRLEAITR